MNNQSVNWSDDDSSSEEDTQNLTLGIQPNRDFPPSDEENESYEEDYDMDSIRQLTIINSKPNTWADMFSDKEKETKKQPISKPNNNNNIHNIHNILMKNKAYEKRKFNPRLPPPEKYKKSSLTNNYKINENEFPTLK
jgi:hypothetical protein